MVVNHNLNIPESGEIGEQAYAEGEEVAALVGVLVKHHAYRQPGREYGRIARGDNGVALLEHRVSRQLLEGCFRGAVACPYERTEIVAALDFAGEAEVRVEQ